MLIVSKKNMWSKAFRDADGVGQVAWLERVKAWKANRNSEGNPLSSDEAPTKLRRSSDEAPTKFCRICGRSGRSVS